MRMKWTSLLGLLFVAGAVGCEDSDATAQASDDQDQERSIRQLEPSQDASVADEDGGATSAGDAGSDAGRGLSDAGSVKCTFDVEHSISTAIATVGIVTWSTDLASVEEARIEFELADGGRKLVAPVNLEAPDYRTLLLGMKGGSEYSFRIIATGERGTCISEAFSLTTGPVPNRIAQIQQEVLDDQAVASGFIVTSAGLGNLEETISGVGSSNPMFVFDSDGDIVWYWETPPSGASRVRMDWSGQNMWMMSLNVNGGMGEMTRVSMDGLDVERDVSGLEEGHHDFTVLPDGSIAAIAHIGDCSGIIERTPDGEIMEVIPDVSDFYVPQDGVFGTVGECHPNYLVYHEEDDTYTISDRNAHVVVKVSRDGDLLWQLGGEEPLGNHFEAEWDVNHGHQLLDNGNLVLFSNGWTGNSLVFEFELDESSWTATEVWSYDGGSASFSLGDVQRLNNGNTLVTYSNAGTIHEVDPQGELVRQVTTESLGYSEHRPSLYGPPTR